MDDTRDVHQNRQDDADAQMRVDTVSIVCTHENQLEKLTCGQDECLILKARYCSRFKWLQDAAIVRHDAFNIAWPNRNLKPATAPTHCQICMHAALYFVICVKLDFDFS
jgi:hypothetical protein